MEKSIKVYNDKINQLQIARYYLESELPNILHADSEQVHTLISASIQSLSDKQVWRLLEALSHTYRINSVFALVSSAGYDWQEIELSLDAITLTGVGPHIDKIVSSEEIQKNPEKFAHYLRAYFSEHPHPDDDPLKLNEFRPREQPPVHDVLMVRQDKEGRFKMVDGTHRLMVRSVLGETAFRCYCAVPNGKPDLRRRGDSIFVTLRSAYFAMPEHQEAILEVAQALAKDSLDGREAVEDYWIAHARSSEGRRVGKMLLARVLARDNNEALE